jgi:hypothetical protein
MSLIQLGIIQGRIRRERPVSDVGLQDLPTEKFSSMASPPWTIHDADNTFHLSAADLCSTSDEPDTRRNAALDILLSLPDASITYWTDGSVVDGSGAGDGGIYIWDPGGLYYHLSWHVPAGRICSFFISLFLLFHICSKSIFLTYFALLRGRH